MLRIKTPMHPTPCSTFCLPPSTDAPPRLIRLLSRNVNQTTSQRITGLHTEPKARKCSRCCFVFHVTPLSRKIRLTMYLCNKNAWPLFLSDEIIGWPYSKGSLWRPLQGTTASKNLTPLERCFLSWANYLFMKEAHVLYKVMFWCNYTSNKSYKWFFFSMI